MKRRLGIINLIGMIVILMAIVSVANAGPIDPLISPLPTSQESAPRVTLAPPPMPSAPQAIPQQAGASAGQADQSCASCVEVAITLCDGSVITVSARSIEVK